MSADQLVTLAVLAAVVAALIWDRMRADIVALVGAAVLLITGAVRPVEVQGAFASPAIIALASLFVIAYAMELSGLLDAAIRKGVALCQRIGSLGLWLLIAMCGAASAFLNNTPIVVMSAPVVRDVALKLRVAAETLSDALVLHGGPGRVHHPDRDFDQPAGQRHGVGRGPASLRHIRDHAGGPEHRHRRRHLSFPVQRPAHQTGDGAGTSDSAALHSHAPDIQHAQLGSPDLFAEGHPLIPWKALVSIAHVHRGDRAGSVQCRADRRGGIRRGGAADRACG